MFPLLCANMAARFFDRRWWFMLVSVCGFGLLAIVLSYAPQNVGRLAVPLAGPVIFVPWGLLCLCVWFHPDKGNLQPGSRFVGKLPQWMQSVVRWYASLFLVIFLAAGLIVWPLFSLITLANG
jgi:hypothetical protein